VSSAFLSTPGSTRGFVKPKGSNKKPPAAATADDWGNRENLYGILQQNYRQNVMFCQLLER